MEFPRQEYWSGLSFPSPGDLSNPGIEPESPALAWGFLTTEPPGRHDTSIKLILKECVKQRTDNPVTRLELIRVSTNSSDDAYATETTQTVKIGPVMPRTTDFTIFQAGHGRGT